MTSCNKDHASFDHLVPLYVKGLLPDAQRREFENAVSECPDLKNTIEEWKLLNDAYKALECRLPEPSRNLFPKITDQILCPNCDHENSRSFTVLHNLSKSLRNIFGPNPQCVSNSPL